MEESRVSKKRKSRSSKPFSVKKRTADEAEIALLLKRLLEEAPPRGTNPLAYFGKEKKEDLAPTKEENDYKVSYTSAKSFVELPISKKTLKGLKNAKFKTMTEIQRAALPHALCGRDVLGAAKTGSGKTLAFVIPILEKLYTMKWTKLDGVGAIIITPTRELALQIFEVLRTVGVAHALSAGLIIGGKDLVHEKQTIVTMNILICTPGRLLQHMDQTAGFDCSNTQVLVLDEADRILDMGFQKSVNAILENLPKQRQTLLFSATQTKSVKDLARLSLKDPEYISVHEKAQFSTPQKLIQNVVFIELQDKVDTLWSFIKTHLSNKVLVFFSSCKQVRFFYEAFRKLRPGTPLMHIHGKMKQTKRMAIYFDFCKKKSAVLFATDIAARGLDFHGINWVIQMDCPEDTQTYIHRAGRTARYESSGFALLFLLPSEKKMVTLLEQSKIPVKVIKVNPKQQKASIQSKLEAFHSEDPELKYLAQKAFISYMRSIWLQSNKEVFDVHQLPAAAFAKSLGLIGTPRIKFGKGTKKDKNFPSSIEAELNDGEGKMANQKHAKTKTEKLFSRKATGVFAESHTKMIEQDEEDGDDFLVPKKKQTESEELEDKDDYAEYATMIANSDDSESEDEGPKEGWTDGESEEGYSEDAVSYEYGAEDEDVPEDVPEDVDDNENEEEYQTAQDHYPEKKNMKDSKKRKLSIKDQEQLALQILKKRK